MADDPPKKELSAKEKKAAAKAAKAQFWRLFLGFSDLSDTLKFQIALIYERNYESIPFSYSRFLQQTYWLCQKIGSVNYRPGRLQFS